MKKVTVLIFFLIGFVFFNYGKGEAACNPVEVINQIKGINVAAPNYIAPTFEPGTAFPGGCSGDCTVGVSSTNSITKSITIPSDCYGYLDITLSGLFSTGWDCWKANSVTFKIGNSSFGYESYTIKPTYPDCSSPQCGGIPFEGTTSYYIRGGPRPNLNVELYYWAKCEVYHNHSGHFFTVSNVNFIPIDTSCPTGSIEQAGICVQGSVSTEPIHCPTGTNVTAWGYDEICINATIDDSGRTCGNGVIDGTDQKIGGEICDPASPNPDAPCTAMLLKKCIPADNPNGCMCAECLTDADCPEKKKYCEGSELWNQPQKCTNYMCEDNFQEEKCGLSGWVDNNYKCINKYTVGQKFEDKKCQDRVCRPEKGIGYGEPCPYLGDWPGGGVQCYIPDPGSKEEKFCQNYSDTYCSLGGCTCFCEAHCETKSSYQINEENYRTGDCRDCIGGGILTPTNMETGEPNPDYEPSRIGSGDLCTIYEGCEIDWPYSERNDVDRQCKPSSGIISKAIFYKCQGNAPNARCDKEDPVWLVTEECPDRCTATGKQRCGTQNNKPAIQAEYNCSKPLVNEKKEAYCNKWTEWRTTQVCSGPFDLAFYCLGKAIHKAEIKSNWTCKQESDNRVRCDASSPGNTFEIWQSCGNYCCIGGPILYGAFVNVTGNFPKCGGNCPTGATKDCAIGECQGTQTCDYSCNWGPCVGSSCHTECKDLKCETISGAGENKCETDEDCKKGQNPPTVTGLRALPETYCTGIPACGEISFQWNYNDQDGDTESRFEMQIDDDGDFSSPEVNRTFSNLSNPSGSTNTQIVLVRTDETSPNCDYITFDKSYYIRVRVWDSTGLNSGWVHYNDPVDSDGDGTTDTFTKDPHPWPSVEFNFLPSNPNPDQEVEFTDLAICYDSDSNPYPCKLENPITHTNNQYTWTFGDGGSSNERGDVSHTYAEVGTYHVTLKVCDVSLYDPANPSDGCCQISHDVPVGTGQGERTPKLWKEIPPSL